jgi:hypothetical protein
VDIAQSVSSSFAGSVSESFSIAKRVLLLVAAESYFRDVQLLSAVPMGMISLHWTLLVLNGRCSGIWGILSVVGWRSFALSG